MTIRNLTRELHISWLVAAWCLGLTVGVIAIHHVPRSMMFDWRLLVLGLGLMAVVMVWRWRALMIVAIISGGLVGLWRGELGRAGLEVYDSLIGKTAVIQGRVLEDPDIDKKGQTVLRLSDLRINGEKLAGQLWVVTADKRPIKRSDIVQVQGKLTAGFGAFSASMYQRKLAALSVQPLATWQLGCATGLLSECANIFQSLSRRWVWDFCWGYGEPCRRN